MGSSSFQFLSFALIVVVVYNLIRSTLWRQLVLLAASLYFLSTFTPSVAAYIPFTVFLVLGYIGLQLVKRFPTQAYTFVIVGTIGVFVWLKKYSLFPPGAFLPFPYLTVGLSYILFRVLHLMIDTRNGLITEDVPPLQYLLYLINFTTLASGPIQKYSDFSKMLNNPDCPRPSLPVIGIAVERVIGGFFKTNVLALIFSEAQNSAIASLEHGGENKLLAGIVIFASYPLFLYCNFSGYIDIVIGIARLLGITLPENFNRPFSSDSFIGFWSRWHITLSEWLKTYVYTPLLMTLMRRNPSPNMESVWGILAFFVTFFLIGVWHGQTAAFLFFGFLQGFGVSLNKLHQVLMTKWLGRKSYRAVSANPFYVIAARGLTFTWFTFTLLWFWSNWTQIGKLWSELSGPTVLAAWAAIFVGSSLILAAWEAIRNGLLSFQWQGIPFLYSRYWRTAWNTGLVVVALSVVLLSNQPAPEIVYKAF